MQQAFQRNILLYSVLQLICLFHQHGRLFMDVLSIWSILLVNSCKGIWEISISLSVTAKLPIEWQKKRKRKTITFLCKGPINIFLSISFSLTWRFIEQLVEYNVLFSSTCLEYLVSDWSNMTKAASKEHDPHDLVHSFWFLLLPLNDNESTQQGKLYANRCCL